LQLEEAIEFRIDFRKFVGLGFEEEAPDSTTFSVFRERILPVHDKLFKILNELLEEAGYQIKESSDGIIHVKVNATPLRNSTPYPTVIENKPARALLDSGQHPHLSAAFRAKTRKLVQPCRGYFQAVSVILNWITRHFHYQLQIKSPLDGDCTAAAQLAVQMLSEAGIPARTVIGIVVESKDHVLSGKALHSFVEIYYPGTGWLFSDPLSSYHYVPANYVLLNTAHASDYFGLTLRTVRQPAPLESVVSHEHSPIPGRINLFRFN